MNSLGLKVDYEVKEDLKLDFLSENSPGYFGSYSWPMESSPGSVLV